MNPSAAPFEDDLPVGVRSPSLSGTMLARAERGERGTYFDRVGLVAPFCDLADPFPFPSPLPLLSIELDRDLKLIGCLSTSSSESSLSPSSSPSLLLASPFSNDFGSTSDEIRPPSPLSFLDFFGDDGTEGIFGSIFDLERFFAYRSIPGMESQAF